MKEHDCSPNFDVVDGMRAEDKHARHKMVSHEAVVVGVILLVVSLPESKEQEVAEPDIVEVVKEFRISLARIIR